MRVLIVDDNADNREMHAMMLADFCEVFEASSGGDALKILEADDKIEAVILDLSMPVLDGLTVAEEIRRNETLHKNKRAVRLAFLTARNIDEVIVRIAHKTNVERIFQKGADAGNFTENVREWLNE